MIHDPVLVLSSAERSLGRQYLPGCISLLWHRGPATFSGTFPFFDARQRETLISCDRHRTNPADIRSFFADDDCSYQGLVLLEPRVYAMSMLVSCCSWWKIHSHFDGDLSPSFWGTSPCSFYRLHEARHQS